MHKKALLLLLLWLAMGAFPAWAQTGVKPFRRCDGPKPAQPLPDVAVTIKNIDTGETRTIATDGGGHYQASGLPPGRFDIRAAKQGFADETRMGISLAAGQDATVDIKLQLSTPDACASGQEFATTDCTLTWHGITLYGAYDVGVGWVSHGLPENGYNYEGESLVNRNGYQHRFLIAPNNLSADGCWHQRQGRVSAWLVRCVQRFHWHQSAIRPARQRVKHQTSSTTAFPGAAIRSPSMARARANLSMTNTMAVYRPRTSVTLTFGRQRSLGTDAMLLYDPANGSYAFSYIGYNGTMAGGGDTENTRWDDAVKYRIAYGPVHFGAMYKFADGSGGCYSASATWTATTCTPESAHNNAYGFDLGGNIGRDQASSPPTSFSSITTRRSAY